MTFLARRVVSTLQDRMNRIFREAFNCAYAIAATFSPPQERT
jgi:hypothetical protein